MKLSELFKAYNDGVTEKIMKMLRKAGLSPVDVLQLVRDEKILEDFSVLLSIEIFLKKCDIEIEVPSELEEEIKTYLESKETATS